MQKTNNRSKKKRVGSFYKKPSRWFTDYKKELGLHPDNRKTKKDFHAFRHSFSTYAERQDMSDKVSYKITGHKNADQDSEKDSAGKVYRHGHTIDYLYEEMQKLNFKKFIPDVKPFFEIYDKKKLGTKNALK